MYMRRNQAVVRVGLVQSIGNLGLTSNGYHPNRQQMDSNPKKGAAISGEVGSRHDGMMMMTMMTMSA